MNVVDTYRPIFDLSPVPMLLAAPDGVIRLVNTELAETFEYEAEALVGQPVECLLPQALRAGHPALRNAYTRLPAKRRMGQDRTLEGMARSGRPVYVDLGLTPIVQDDGVWTLITATDTSAVKRGATLASATLEAAACAMIMVSQNGKIVSVNRAGLELFGYAETELVGQPVEVLVPEDVGPVHHVFRNSFFEASRPRSMGTGAPLHGRHRDGTEFRLEVALTPVETDETRLVLATIVDLSERLAAERALAAQQSLAADQALAAQQAAEAQANRLTHLNDELTLLAYSASHDLKGPLATISGMLELCLDDLDAGHHDTLNDNLASLLGLSRQSAQKVESVLQLARTGQQQQDPRPLDLEQTLKRIWQASTELHVAPPRFETSVDLTGPLLCNTSAMDSVLENLLSNAIKFADPEKPEPFVRATAKQLCDTVEITIEDNGIGVSRQDQEAVFGMFRKLTDHPGHGLGLAMVRRNMDLLGGSIRCEGERGKGCVFTLTLPLRGVGENGEGG